MAREDQRFLAMRDDEEVDYENDLEDVVEDEDVDIADGDIGDEDFEDEDYDEDTGDFDDSDFRDDDEDYEY